MRVGIIGMGRIGTFHAGILNRLPQVDEVTVTDSDPGRATEAGERLGVRVCPDLDSLLAAVDALVITAATSAHPELIVRGVRAGLPVFCEKPIALDLKSTRDVVRFVSEHGAVVQMGFQRRFDPGYQAAADLVRTGGLGKLYVVRMAGHDPEPPHQEYIPHSGGIFRDFSVHDFDALRFVTGRQVVEVYADGSVLAFPVFEEYGDVDTAVATLRLEGGALAILSVTRHDPRGYDIRMELFGSGDSVTVGWDDRMPLRSLEPEVPPPVGPPYARFQDRFRVAYEGELAAFLEVVQGKRENPCTPEDAMEAMRVATACDLSRAQHRPVGLAEVG